MIITDLAVFERPDHASPFRLIELAPGVTAEEVRADDGAIRQLGGFAREKIGLPLAFGPTVYSGSGPCPLISSVGCSSNGPSI